jgi:hypothetical protein
LSIIITSRFRVLGGKADALPALFFLSRFGYANSKPS